MKELNHLMQLSPDGVQVHRDGDAQNNNIEEWFDTPEGTIADNPAWGHNLRPFWFEPEGSEDIAVALEMSIAEKLPRDVVGVEIYNISVTFVEFDRCQVILEHNFGTYRNDNYRIAA